MSENEKLCEELNLKKQQMKTEVDRITEENIRFIKDTNSTLELGEKIKELESLSTRLNNSLGLLNKQIDTEIDNIKNNFAYEESSIKSYSDSINQTIESIHKKQAEISALAASTKITTEPVVETKSETKTDNAEHDMTYPTPEPEEEPEP